MAGSSEKVHQWQMALNEHMYCMCLSDLVNLKIHSMHHNLNIVKKV